MIYLQDSAEMAVSNCPTNKHKHTDVARPEVPDVLKDTGTFIFQGQANS
jgi:hypothetical protein